jgi:DNA end-binding protein Ku
MASTVWKGQLTFGMVSFPVRLVRAARKERIALKYVREAQTSISDDDANASEGGRTMYQKSSHSFERDSISAPEDEIVPVRQGYFSEGQREPSSTAGLQRGYEIAPDQFVVVRREELRSLRKATSPDMPILRSVKMQEIDPVFLETSYYVLPGAGGEHSYGLFYQALSETKLAALAQVAMHGREHVIVVRAGAKGLIAHTMFYVNEVRGAEEYAIDPADVVAKELDMAKKYVQALEEPFRPEEFTDGYRAELQALIASKGTAQLKSPAGDAPKPKGNVVDIMEALRKSLEAAKANQIIRKPVAQEVEGERKPRRRKA